MSRAAGRFLSPRGAAARALPCPGGSPCELLQPVEVKVWYLSGVLDHGLGLVSALTTTAVNHGARAIVL